MECLLCLQKKSNQIKLCSKKGQDLNISTVIAKHFWLRPNGKKDSKESICSACWTTVRDFNEFYQTVAEAHNYLEAENVELNEGFPQPKKEEPLDVLNAEFGTDEIKLEIDDLEALPGTEVIENAYVPKVIEISEEKKVEPIDVESPVKSIKEETTNDDDSESEIPLSKFLQSDIKIDEKSLSDNEAETTFDDGKPSSESSDSESEKVEKGEPQPVVFAEIQPKKKDLKKPKRRYNKKELSDTAKKRSYGKKLAVMEQYDEIIGKMFDKFPCPACNLYVRNFSDMIKHYKEAPHNDGRPSVTCCERKFYQRPTLADHVMVHLNPEHFKCEKCGHLSRDKLQFKEHNKTHDLPPGHSKKNFECPICEKKLASKLSVEKHKIIKHTPKSEYKFDCPECPKMFPTKNCVRKHLRDTHHGGRSAMCDHCGKTCQTKYILQKHIAHEHLNIPKPAPIKAQCPVCQIWLRDIYSVRNHMKTAHDDSDKEHKCEICGYISVNGRSLTRHIEYVHKLERRYPCSLCEKSFRRAHELREHTSTHTGKVLFTCAICSMSFYSKANYYKHRRKDHGHEPKTIRRNIGLNKKPKKEKVKKEETEVEGETGTKKRRRRRKKNAPPEESNIQNSSATIDDQNPTILDSNTKTPSTSGIPINMQHPSTSETIPPNVQDVSIKQEPYVAQGFSTFEAANLQHFSASTTIEEIPGHFLSI